MEWLSATPPGPLGPGFAKIFAIAVPLPRLALPSQRSWCVYRRRGAHCAPAKPSPRGADSPYQGEMSRSDRGDREAVERSETDEGANGGNGRSFPPPPHPSFAAQMPPSPCGGKALRAATWGRPYENFGPLLPVGADLRVRPPVLGAHIGAPLHSGGGPKNYQFSILNYQFLIPNS